MPGAEVIAVIALSHLPGGRSKILEIGGCVWRLVFVIAWDRVGAGFESTPSRFVEGLVIVRASIGICVVTQSKDDGVRVFGDHAVHDLGSLFVVLAVIGDIA